MMSQGTVAVVAALCFTIHRTSALFVEDFFVEHEVSWPQARAAAAKMNITTMSDGVGCQPCTKSELRYCAGSDLINDHCCCDKRFIETFLHVPHTCYLGRDRCQPIARDCGEYERLRACCCDKHVAMKWKAKSGSTRLPNAPIFISLSIVLIMSKVT